VEYHRKRAAAGCGLVIVEHAFVQPRGRHTPTQIGVHDDALIDGLSRLASAIRGAGAVACLQISHAGSRTSAAVAGATPLGPSAVPNPAEKNSETPEVMTEADIRETVGAFGAAAERAQRAGFDAVEIHAAHAFLLCQFLSPLTNRRSDAHGGDEERRRRIHLEVLGEVRRRLNGAIPVFVRLGAHDEMSGGLELDAAVRTAEALVDGGVALIDVSGGLCGSQPTGKSGVYFAAYARAIKDRVGVPVLVTGGVTDPEQADAVVHDGFADLVGIGRAMLNDAEWARQALERLTPRT
jgi:2,4-dienoyl-CoA reductase-like NADH-dependent reductase (Old Yellow Enzyme family)